MKANGKYIRLFRTIGITGLAFVINYLISLILTPYITDRAGSAAYGFVTLAKNIGQYATILTVALNSFSSRYIGVAYHKKDFEQAKIYFSSTFYGNVVLGAAVFLLAGVGIVFLDKLFIIPEELVPDVKFLFLIVFVNFLAITIFTVYGTGATVAGRLDITGVFKLLSYLADAAVLLVAFRFVEAKVYPVGFGLMAASAVIILSNVMVCRKYTPELKPERKYYRFSAVKRLVLDGLWTTVNELGALLHSGLDLVVCNLMISPTGMGQLSIAKDIDLIFHSLYQLVGVAFQPMFLQSYAKGDKVRLLKDLKLSMKLSGLLSNLAFAGFFSLGMVYYKLWIPNQDIDLIWSLTMITVLTSVASGSMNPLYYIYTLTVKMKFPCIVTVITGFMNVAGMFVLIRYTEMGIFAVVWTTAVLIFFINFVSNPIYMAHVLELPKTTFYPGIIRNVISCGVLTGVFKGLSLIYMPDSWLTLILCAVIYAGIGSVIHMVLVLNREEWGDLKKKALRRLGKDLPRETN